MFLFFAISNFCNWPQLPTGDIPSLHHHCHCPCHCPCPCPCPSHYCHYNLTKSFATAITSKSSTYPSSPSEFISWQGLQQDQFWHCQFLALTGILSANLSRYPTASLTEQTPNFQMNSLSEQNASGMSDYCHLWQQQWQPVQLYFPLGMPSESPSSHWWVWHWSLQQKEQPTMLWWQVWWVCWTQVWCGSILWQRRYFEMGWCHSGSRYTMMGAIQEMIPESWLWGRGWLQGWGICKCIFQQQKITTGQQTF